MADEPAAAKVAIKLLMTKSLYFPVSLGEYLSDDDVCAIVDECGASFGKLLDGLYSALAEKAGAKVAGDKSPNDLACLDILVKTGALDSPRRIIHVVRDIRDVLGSILNQGWVQPGARRQFARNWAHQNLHLHTIMGGDSRYLLVRYEDFVRQPTAQMTRLLAHLGQEFHPDVLDPTRRHARYQNEPHHPRLYEPINPDAVGSHRQRLKPSLRAACEREARAAMVAFGYANENWFARLTEAIRG
jgi:hypothetical protein